MSCQTCPDLLEEIYRLKAEIERLREQADALAYWCAKAVCNGTINSRSRIADSLMDYLNVGGIDGPTTIPQWIAEYEASHCGRG